MSTTAPGGISRVHHRKSRDSILHRLLGGLVAELYDHQPNGNRGACEIFGLKTNNHTVLKWKRKGKTWPVQNQRRGRTGYPLSQTPPLHFCQFQHTTQVRSPTPRALANPDSPPPSLRRMTPYSSTPLFLPLPLIPRRHTPLSVVYQTSYKLRESLSVLVDYGHLV